jgi:hypothetical protein
MIKLDMSMSLRIINKLKIKTDDIAKDAPPRVEMRQSREIMKRPLNEFSNKLQFSQNLDDEYFQNKDIRQPANENKTEQRKGHTMAGGDSFGKVAQAQTGLKRERRSKKNFDYMKEMNVGAMGRGQPGIPVNPQDRYQRNKNFNSSSNYDGMQQQINLEGEEFNNPIGSELLEGPSIYSNNKIVVNEDKLTGGSKPDSINFGVGDDEVKDCFLNKEIPADNDMMNPFGRATNDPSPTLFDDSQKLQDGRLLRQDSTRFQQMESAGFGGGNGGYLMPMSSFKSNDMDYIEGGYNRSFSSTFGPNNYP